MDNKQIKVNNNLETPTSCSSCSVNSACGVGIFSKFFKRKVDINSTEISEKEFIINSFLLYLIPIILLIIGAILAENFYPQSTIIAIIFSITGFILGTLLLFFKKINILRLKF